jgi:hypothetical protein
MPRVKYFLITSIIFITVIFTQDTPKPSLQIDADSTKKTPVVTVDIEEEEKDKSKLPAFEELVDDYEKISGLFDMYWDIEKNAAYFSIHPDQFEQIYLWNVTRQSGDAAYFDSGSMMGSFPFFFKKFGESIQLIEANTRYRAEENTPTARAIKQQFPNAILLKSKILSEPDSINGKILIDMKDFFLTDKYTLVGYRTGKWKRKYNFDKDNSSFTTLKSFTENTEVGVALHFKSDKPHSSSTLADSRSMLHKYHFSLSAIPESDYQPRVADDRVGHFQTFYQDYSSLDLNSPYKYYINRWNLVKKDPGAKLSEPVEPIVFWIENTTPEKYRQAIAEGILMWNEAFERIGFKNAMVANIMPDDADWDPADSRYNTIRWIIQPGGGYAVGPSRANPFTGELYDADIRISSDYVRHFYREYDEFITPVSMSDVLNWMDPPNELENYNNHQCEYSQEKHRQMVFASNFLLANGTIDTDDLEEFVMAGLSDLVVHEVGHTLGLRHNFRGTSIYPLELLKNYDFTNEYGIAGSVMDYTPINLSPEGEPQGSYYHTTLGVYDYWAIEYAYRPFDKSEFETEDEFLKSIASRSAEPLLAYCTDEDARGYSMRGMDPSCNLYDMTSDPLEYYQARIEMVNELWKILPEKFESDNESYYKLRSVFGQGIGEYRNMCNNVPKYIGGVYAYRDHVGDPNGRIPFEVVPALKQRQALEFLNAQIFSEDAFQFSPELLNKLAPRYFGDFQGSNWTRARHDYPIHDVVFAIQARALSRLYSKSVLNRMQDNELKTPINEEIFKMSELFNTLQMSLWSEMEQRENINSYRRKLQRTHVHIMVSILLQKNNDYPGDAVSLARNNLIDLKSKIKRIKSHPALDSYTKVHLTEIESKISSALEATLNREM